MMFIGNKEEGQVGAQVQRLNEPNSGMPIKKRPFQLNNPSSLESSATSLDNFSFMPKNFTPKSPLDFSTLGFDPGNPCSSGSDKPAGVSANPFQDSSAIDVGRNYCPLKPLANPNFGVEALENFKQCSTDLSLTGPATISSKVYSEPCHNLSNISEERSVLDLNLPTAETWDSAMDDYTFESNGIAQTEPVEALARQGTVNGMIPQRMVSGVFPSGVVTGLLPNGIGNSPKLPNMEKLSEKCNLSEVTLDLQLKLPPRPELRMKNFEHVCSSDLSLSLSGKDLNSSAEPVNVKAELAESSQKSKEKDVTSPNVKPVENSQKSKEKDITNPNVKPVENSQESKEKDITDCTVKPAAQNQVIVKQELREVTLPENVVQASGLKDQSSASGSVVKKEPVDTIHPQQPLGNLLDKSPCSESEPRRAKQADMSNKSCLTKKGIDLNSATPLPVASTGSKMVNPVIASSAVANQIVQSAISQSDESHKSDNIDTGKFSVNTSCSVPTSSPLAGTEDIKPVNTSSPAPALVVNNGKRMVPMASDGLSQGSADMDCSEEGQNLLKSTTTGKTMENANRETNASSSSSVAKTPKQEPGTNGECENSGIREENEKNLVSLSTPTPKENQTQTPSPAEANSGKNSENGIPSSSAKLINEPNKSMQGSLDMEAGGSKSGSPSTSMSRSDKEVDLPSSERENGTSSRQIEGNNFFHRRFKRTDSGPDRAQFLRKKSLMNWDEGSNFHSKRGQRWEGHRFSKFDGDRFENEDNLGRGAGINMANRKGQNNRFNSRFGHKKTRGFRFTRTSNNSDMNFDEGNDGRRRLSDDGSRPYPSRFQNRRRVADASPRGADEPAAPAFDHPNNHYKRADHAIIRRDRSFSPGPRRGPYQWTPQGEMTSGHTDMLTRVDTRARSPGRRPFFKKDNMNRRHVSPSYNRVHKPGRNMHWNNRRQQRSDMGDLHEPVADMQGLEAYDELSCHGGEMIPSFHVRYPDNDGAYTRNCETSMNRLREVGDQHEYRYNNRGPHGWRDGNPNNNGDKLKRRRY